MMAATLQTIVNCFKGRFDRHSADNRYQLKMPNETTIQTLSLLPLDNDNTLYEDRSTGILAIQDRMMMMIMNSKVTLERTPALKYSYMLMTQKYIKLFVIRVISRNCRQY